LSMSPASCNGRDIAALHTTTTRTLMKSDTDTRDRHRNCCSAHLRSHHPAAATNGASSPQAAATPAVVVPLWPVVPLWLAMPPDHCQRLVGGARTVAAAPTAVAMTPWPMPSGRDRARVGV
jgi:hypothetical protein